MKRVAFLLLLLAIPAAAENSPVRAVSEEIRSYLSPMVLELDLSEFLALPPGKTWTTEAMKLFSCRGVTFESLQLRAVPDDPRTVFLHARVKNNSGKDKRVRMSFANAEKSIGCVVKVSPDETKLCPNTLVQPGPTVRITVTADDY